MAPCSDTVRIADPALRGRLVFLLVGVALVGPLLVVGEFRPWVLFDAASVRASRQFLGGFFPPQLSPDFLILTLNAAWITVAIATAGLCLALMAAIPLALIATRQLSVSTIGRDRMDRWPAIVRGAIRALLVVVRSVPELVLALLFVRVVGLGPTAGVLAIAIAYGAMLAKVFCDIVESNDRHASAALLANGSGRLAAFVYGTLPQCLSELASYLVYRWECAVRASVVMGFVGAGGLGQETDASMKMMAGNEVATLLVMFMLLVWAADLVSGFVRRRLDAGEPNPTRRRKRDSAPRFLIAPKSLAFTAGIVALVAASFASLHMAWGELFDAGAATKMGEFASGFAPPDFSPRLLARIAVGAAETIAMSLIGTLIATLAGVLIALPASRRNVPVRAAARLLLNFLRAVPELVWAAILVISAGLGPFAGTMALALHTTGVLGRLFADTLENLPAAPAAALRDNGAGAGAVFLYARLPQALPQFLSYALYRWENNIRAATVLGVVGAGGLGQMLYFSLSLFQMRQAATVIIAMITLVLLVDGFSHWLRGRLTR